MERVCFLLQVRPERLDEYKDRHAHVWPEMLDALVASGYRNYSIFLRPDGLLVGYFECDDFAAVDAAMQATDVNARWQAEMAEFMTLPEGARAGEGGWTPDQGLLRLEEVFHVG